MTKHDLTTTEGRINSLRELATEFKEKLKAIGIELSSGALVQLSGNSIVFSIRKEGTERDSLFGSEITLYRNKMFSDEKLGQVTIDFGSSGAFNPLNIASYWKTITSASLLKNWDSVIVLVEEYCIKHENLFIEIKRVNNV